MAKTVKTLLLFVFAATASLAADDIGFVNFSTCVSESKIGQAEVANFENLKKQCASHVEELDKQLNDLTAKLNDSEYMDGLSPEAVSELKNKISSLNEELMRSQNQFYQLMNQTQMKLVQGIAAKVATASEAVAKTQKKAAILNKDSGFYFDSSLDMTSLIIAEMDKAHDEESTKKGKS